MQYIDLPQDDDGDGTVSLEELKTMMKAFDVPQVGPIHVFRKICAFSKLSSCVTVELNQFTIHFTNIYTPYPGSRLHLLREGRH